MGVKATIQAPAKKVATPAKNSSVKSVQRKSTPGLFSTFGSVQRKESPGSWIHNKAQKPVNSRPLIQPKIKVHASNDHYEKEADSIADKVTGTEKISSPVTVSKVAPSAQRKCASCEGEDKSVQALHIQRKCASCEEKETVQAKTHHDFHSTTDRFNSSDSGPPAGNTHSNHTLDSVLSAQSSRGSPLPSDTRANMESRMGADFSNVRIHTGSESNNASASIGAKAFTNGANIHFAGGEFNPQTKSGNHLLAHELAHTLQQGAAPSKIKPTSGPVKGLRKLVPKARHEKKIARLSSPYDNKEAARKKGGEEFSNKFRNKKTPKLPSGTLAKSKEKKLNVEPAALPKKEAGKKDKPAPAAPKVNHLKNAISHQSQVSQLASRGINFKADPDSDKQAEADPAQKIQKFQSKKISEGVLSKAASSAGTISTFLSQVRLRLSASSSKSIARVKANEMAQKEKISTETKTEKDAVKKAMQHAAGSISGYHKKVTGEIKAAAIKAKADILVAKTVNTIAIELAAILQIPKIDKAYDEAKIDFEISGRTIGNKCYDTQSDRSWNQFISRMIHEDDSFLDGPYTDDIKQAKGDAAVKVGEGYRDGITKAGLEQGAAVADGKPNDYAKVSDAKAEMLSHLNKSYDDTFQAIEASEKSGISQADSTKKSMLSSIYKQHKAAQAKLDVTQKTQTQFAEILSLKQSQQIELQAAQASEAMEEGGAQSLASLNSSFKEYKQVCESMNSPPPAMLQLKLQPIETALSANAPSMVNSLQKGMAQSEAGFNKTANETIATTNTAVTESLAEAKATNDKAIDGLKKLQNAGVTALQGILNKNKKSITDSASQCVTNIQSIKSEFDGALIKISTDLDSGLKKGSLDLRTGLQSAVDNGTAENKSMRLTSEEEEKKAADEVSPRWKSVLKVLLVIAVILVIALVVGPAVIGFIGAAAGGGAFGAAVGAVVGGAILGAASSAVITIGNNLIDGKTWYEGVGHAMLEGAITGAIGGAFGAAGGGLAGKILGQAAKGIGPALGRFAIQQAVDFGGNVVTEYASSKLQGKPFSWTSVAQGQATGAGMHVAMGGLGALKNIKGFKAINNIMESSAKAGEKFGGSARAKFSGAPKIEPHISVSKPTIEEPLNKGPSAENKAPAPKEELPVTKPAEENLPATKPKEEAPVSSKPSEEVKGVPKEEPLPAKVKEEPKPSATTEEPTTPGGKKKSELPANLDAEDVELGVIAKEPTEDGHHVKVTENGEIVMCSDCIRLETKYSRELADPKTKQEFEDIKKMPDGEAKAKAAKNFDRRMEDRLVRQYKKGKQTTVYEDLEIKQRIRNGDRMNPETGLFNKPKGVELEVDKPAKFKKEGTEVDSPTKVDEYKPEDFHKDVKSKTDDLLKQREAAQNSRDAHAEGTPKYKQHQTEVIKASENIGNTSAEGVARAKGFDKEPLNVGDAFQEGKGTFDRVFEKDGKYLVAESKGGNSDLGSKEVIVKGEPVRVEQGTKEYFESTCRDMMGPNRSPQEQALGAKLLAASKAGQVEYILVKTPVNVKNELGTVKAKTFDN